MVTIILNTVLSYLHVSSKASLLLIIVMFALLTLAALLALAFTASKANGCNSYGDGSGSGEYGMNNI